jgi:hypothetical protein
MKIIITLILLLSASNVVAGKDCVTQAKITADSLKEGREDFYEVIYEAALNSCNRRNSSAFGIHVGTQYAVDLIAIQIALDRDASRRLAYKLLKEINSLRASLISVSRRLQVVEAELKAAD